jgi:hypothetical protein
MKHCIASLILLPLLGCQAFVAVDASEGSKTNQLSPDPAQCFATPDAKQFDIGILGKGWAIQFSVPGERNLFPTGVLHIAHGLLHRGPELEKYIKPPAGPATPPLPKSDDYLLYPLTNVILKVVGGVNEPEPRGYVVLSMSSFDAGGKTYKIVEPITLRFRGPYP